MIELLEVIANKVSIPALPVSVPMSVVSSDKLTSPKAGSKRAIVERYLEEHPGIEESETVRKIAELTGVNRDTVNQVIRAKRGQSHA